LWIQAPPGARAVPSPLAHGRRSPQEVAFVPERVGRGPATTAFGRCAFPSEEFPISRVSVRLIRGTGTGLRTPPHPLRPPPDLHLVFVGSPGIHLVRYARRHGAAWGGVEAQEEDGGETA